MKDAIITHDDIVGKTQMIALPDELAYICCSPYYIMFFKKKRPDFYKDRHLPNGGAFLRD